MGLFKNRGSKNGSIENAIQKTIPVSSESTIVPDVLSAPNKVSCTILEPRRWTLEATFRGKGQLSVVEEASDLPSSANANSAGMSEDLSSKSTSSRRGRRKVPVACALRVEVQDEDGTVIRCSHGISEAFYGLDDKDELVRTMQRCRCDHLEISPPSKLISWDATREECMNVVGDTMPTLSTNKGSENVAVLKEPMGSKGDGIFFVTDAEEIHSIIKEHRKRAVEEPNFLDNLIASKGRIPSWVLQAEVHPCLLIKNRRKFHIRTYLLGIEDWETDDMIETYIYKRHEVRIASQSVQEEGSDSRSREAHITNGVDTYKIERELLDDIPELEGLNDKLESYVAQVFNKHLIGDISRRVAVSAGDENTANAKKFAIAGLDMMVTEDRRFYLLEVNVNPSIAPAAALSDKFREHLECFMGDVVDMLVGNQSPNFISTTSLLSESTR